MAFAVRFCFGWLWLSRTALAAPVLGGRGWCGNGAGVRFIREAWGGRSHHTSAWGAVFLVSGAAGKSGHATVLALPARAAAGSLMAPMKLVAKRSASQQAKVSYFIT